MSSQIITAELYEWCRIPYIELERNPLLKVPFRLVKDSVEMGMIMARELADEIAANNSAGKITRAIGLVMLLHIPWQGKQEKVLRAQTTGIWFFSQINSSG